MSSDVVQTIKNMCRRCYNCVRYCPAKAIKVESGQAVVIGERCIGCGYCVKVCPQNAKRITSSVDRVVDLLKSGRKVVVMLAPSFPGQLEEDETPGQVVAAYKKMGFYKVVEVAFGADLISKAYKKLYEEGGRHYITTACPAVNYYVQKYHPEIIENLTPVVSPMIAMGLAVKKEYGNDVAIVFSGPCIAKKKEIMDPGVEGIIDEVLTFQETRQLREEFEIVLKDLVPERFDPPHPSWGRAFPITGGALISSELENDILDYNVEAIDGREKLIDFINEFQSGRANCKMAETLFCEGCINGPMISDRGGVFARKRRVSDFIKTTQRAFNVEEWQYYMKKYEDIDLTRPFLPENVEMMEPSDEDITKVLNSLNMYSEQDRLNCGACGYENCRSLAKAVCEGLAEKEMCMSYTIDELEKTLRELHRSHDELKTAQQQLIQSAKQASLGQLAAGVAHELNNPLGTILLYADLLLRELKEDTANVKDLALISEEARRCKNIVSGLLNFSRQREVFCRKVDLNRLLQDTISLIENQKLRNGIHFEYNLAENLPLVELDPEQIKQVIVNLVMNAVEAMNEKGTITISSRCLTSQEKIEFSVADSGPGITPDNLKKLFTPFFTTKQIGQGTGLGLAICYGIIKMHRGDIKVNTEIGKGAVFTVTLPLMHDIPSQRQLLGDPAQRNQLAASFQPRRFTRFEKEDYTSKL